MIAKKYSLFVLFVLTSIPSLSDNLKGAQTGLLERQNKNFFLSHGKKRTLLNIPNDDNKQHYEFLLNQPVRITSERSTPVLLAGSTSLRGKLIKNSSGKLFLITESQEIPVTFAETTLQNGFKFDEISQEYFVNADVDVSGNITKNGELEINAIVPTALFKLGSKSEVVPEKLRPLLQTGYRDFITTGMFKNSFTQKPRIIRFTYRSLSRKDVNIGDKGLLLTLSGRQGDSNGTAGGHLASGIVEVMPDFSLQGEVLNIYYPNSKGILSANADLLDYYGNINRGQNQFRPTWTVIIYGISTEKLEALKKLANEYHRYLRNEEPAYGLNSNCTTATTSFLDQIGIYSNDRHDMSVQDLLKLNAWVAQPIPYLKDITHLAAYPMSSFLPRNAFSSILANLDELNTKEDLGITRIDMVFWGQVPSARPVGGAPINRASQILLMNKSDPKVLETIE